MDLWQRFQEQECTQTDGGVLFVVEDDLRKLTPHPTTSTTKKALACLRSLNRLREIRTSGVLRHALVQ